VSNPSASSPVPLPPPEGPVDLLFIAGEASGDEHAARLLREVRAHRPDLRTCALGGPRLAEAGARLLYDLTQASSIGFAEVLKRYRTFFRPLFDDTVRWIEEHRPRVVCCVDYGGFNIRLAEALRERRLSRKGGGAMPVLYFISPQVWASRAGRRFRIARNFDALAAIFPFEPGCYADTDLPVEYVGHPFLRPGFTSPVRFDPHGPILLLPGSRRQAVARIFPALLAGFAEFGRGRAVVLYPNDDIRRVLEAANPPNTVALQPTGEPVGAAAVLTSSGTMSLHCALAGIPGAVVYRTDTLTYLLGRLLVTVKYLGIANLLLQQPMYPEYLQGAATGKVLAAELRDCLDNAERRRKTAELAERLRSLLTAPPRHTASEWLLGYLP